MNSRILQVQNMRNRIDIRALLRALVRPLLLVVGWLLIAASGYFLTYQLFFTSMPLESVSYEVSGAEQRDFRYDGVKYFRGHELAPGDTLELSYVVPRVFPLGEPQLTVYLERVGPGDTRPTEFPEATLILEGDGFESGNEHALEPARLQRYTIPLEPPMMERNETTLTYQSDGDDAVIVATNITGFNVWGCVFGLAIPGIAALAVAAALSGRPYRVSAVNFLIVGGIVALAYWIHSGAFISNVFFSGHAKLSGLQAHLARLISEGTLRSTYYRESGSALMLLPIWLVEGRDFIAEQGFRLFYPSSRYFVFALFLASTLSLYAVIARSYGRIIGLVFACLIVTFFPFINDLYHPDADAYFILLFPFVLALFLRLVSGHGQFVVNLGLLLILFAVMGSIKINPIFLVVILPLGLFLASGAPLVRRTLMAGTQAATLFIAFVVGGMLANSLQHPDRNIGIEGEAFQESVVWHMIWAAYGTFDDHSAHWFTKTGSLRKERVSDATGLENTGYVHQAQLATEEVYRPGIINALKEDSGFFYSTAMLRFYDLGLKFYRYTFGGGQSWRPWVNRTASENRTVSGERVSGLDAEGEAIRYGEAWKISPLIALAKLTQRDLSQLADAALLGLAFVGMLAFKNPGLRAFLVLVALAQIGFNTGVHGINRYFMFCSYALLLGLAAFLTVTGRFVVNARLEGWQPPGR